MNVPIYLAQQAAIRNNCAAGYAVSTETVIIVVAVLVVAFIITCWICNK